MRNLYLSFSILFFSGLAEAQVLRNTSGTTMSVTGGTTVTLSGVNLQNDGGATINHAGTLVMAGDATARDIINDGVFDGTAVGAVIRMTGTTEQQIAGSAVVDIYDFQVNNGGNGTSVSNTGALRIHHDLLLLLMASFLQQTQARCVLPRQRIIQLKIMLIISSGQPLWRQGL
ncbi:MAG: hypothetical protein SFU27_01865 [Thermonemataceae bacterium]|nr:hypothetical protein [Thermonemataceae bacterium]